MITIIIYDLRHNKTLLFFVKKNIIEIIIFAPQYLI